MKYSHGFAPLVLALSFASMVGGWGQSVPPLGSSQVVVDGPLAAPLSVEQAVAEALQCQSRDSSRGAPLVAGATENHNRTQP